MPDLNAILGNSKNGFTPAPQFQSKPPLKQSDIDAIWGTHAKTSIIPQEQTSQAQPMSWTDKLFGNPLMNALEDKANSNLQPEQQPIQRSNPVSALGETAKNVGSFALDAMNPANSPLTQIAKSKGIATPSADAGSKTFTEASNFIGGKGGQQVIPTINQLPQKIGQDIHDQMNSGKSATSFQDYLVKNDLAKNKMISDALGGIFAPANVLPETVKQGFSTVFGGVKNAITSGVQGMGIDPSSSQGQDIIESLNNAFQVGLIAHGAKKKAPEVMNDNLVKSENFNLPNKELNQQYFDQRMQDFTKNENTVNPNQEANSVVDSLIKTPEERQAIYQQNIKKNVAQIVQGKPSDIPIATRALGEIDHQGIKTYEDLHRTIEDKVNEMKKAVDERLQQQPESRPLTDYQKTIKNGTKSITINPVEDALAQLQELYTTTKDPASQLRIESLIDKAKSDGLSLKEVNDIAREYGSEFGQKAFSKTGDPLTSVNAQAYENTRSAIKDAVRQNIPDNATKILDQKMSDLLRTKDLVKKMVDRANALRQKVQERGVGEKIGRTVGTVLDVASGHALKGIVEKFLSRGTGLKTLNALDLEAFLSKNLEKINKASSAIDKIPESASKLKTVLKAPGKGAKTLYNVSKIAVKEGIPLITPYAAKVHAGMKE